MSEPVTAYMVTEGEYSDYGVRAVFEREADAVAAQKAGLGDDVAEIRFFPAGAVLPTKLLLWNASCGLGPGNHEVRTFSREAWSSDQDLPPERRAVVNEHWWANRAGGTVSAQARTEQLARKACADRVAKIRAEALEPGVSP